MIKARYRSNISGSWDTVAGLMASRRLIWSRLK